MSLARLKAVAGALAVLLALALVAWATGDDSGEPEPGSTSGRVDPVSGLAWIAEAELPPQAHETLRLVDRGGPFPYSQDGSRFGNFEGLLPQRPSGYYREYTVPTPGAKNRGARRIVTGEDDEFYWTEDHYESFERIARSP